MAQSTDPRTVAAIIAVALVLFGGARVAPVAKIPPSRKEKEPK